MANLQQIGQYQIEDIKRATVVVPLQDESGNERQIPFSFHGETMEHGDHLKLYIHRENVQHLSTEDNRIKGLEDPYSQGDARNTYLFHKEDVYVAGENDIYYEQTR